MPPKSAKKTQAVKTLQPVQVKACISVQGGYLHHAVLVDSVSVPHMGEDVVFVGVSHQDSWFCEMVANKAFSTRPLSKSNALQNMRMKLTRALMSLPEPGEVAEPDAEDKMAGSAYSEEEPEVNPSPTKKHKAVASALAGKEGAVTELRMLATPGASPEVPLRPVRFLNKKGSKLWVEVDALSWLSNFVREEMGTLWNVSIDSGVEPPNAQSPIVWDFSNECWVFRGVDKVGEPVRRYGRIKGRMSKGGDLDGLSFAEAKERVFKEMQAYVAELCETTA